MDKVYLMFRPRDTSEPGETVQVFRTEELAFQNVELGWNQLCSVGDEIDSFEDLKQDVVRPGVTLFYSGDDGTGLYFRVEEHTVRF